MGRAGLPAAPQAAVCSSTRARGLRTRGAPVSRYDLTFRVDFLPGWEHYRPLEWGATITAEECLEQQERERQARQRIYNSFGLKLFSLAWATVSLTPQRAEKLGQVIADLVRRNVACLGSGQLYEMFTPEEEEACEWFLIDAPHSGCDSDFYLGEYPTCHADRYLPTQHVLAENHVSERFVEAVKSAGLTGLEFLWVRDKGRYAAPQWYRAIASLPLGHGVDHPWFDFRRFFNGRMLYRQSRLADEFFRDALGDRLPLYEAGTLRPPDAIVRAGVRDFDNRHLDEGWTTRTDAIDEVIRGFPSDDSLGLSIAGVPRYLRAYLPGTDFAYSWSMTDTGTRGFVPSYNLCCNRKARQALLAAKLVQASALRGILTLDSPPPGRQDLDAVAGGCPPQVHRPDELIELRRMEVRYRTAFDAKQRPSRRPDMKRAVKLLRQAKKQHPEAFKPGLSAKRAATVLAGLPFALPSSWVEVLGVSNGMTLESENAQFTTTPIEQLATYHVDRVTDRKRNDEDYSASLLYVGETDGGDHLTLESDGRPGLDTAPVVLLSHEDFSVERRWESIAEFLEAIISGE
jgi:hypothetical protein